MAIASNASNVLAGKPLVGGGIFVAPMGAVRPTGATTALNPAYRGTGYVSEDGVTETVDRSTDKIRAWGGDTVKVVQSEFGVQYEFTFIETLNSEVLKTVYGGTNVTTTAATGTKGTLHKVKLNSGTLPEQQFVIDMKDGNATVRISFFGQISEVGEITYSDEEVIGYPVTVLAIPDANGDSAVKYLDDGVKTGG